MKHLKIFLSLIVLFSLPYFSSCHKTGNSPVDRIVEILDEAIDKTEDINSMAELVNIQNIVSPEEVWQIIRENSDYKLTDGDKEKLKKTYNKLVKTAYDKSAEYVQNDVVKQTVKSQLDLVMEAIDQSIDNAETLGGIKAFN